MDDYLNQAADKQTLDSKASEYNLASKQNQDSNDEHREELKKFYDKIALYSAGAISFSTTIIGLVLANYPLALAQTLFLIPNMYYLYGSWFCFAMAFVSALLSRKFGAYYVSAFGFAHYTKDYHAFLEEQLRFITKYKDNVVFQGGSFQEHVVTDHSNIQKLKEAHGRNEHSSKIYFRLMRASHFIAETGAALGLILLLLFSVFLTQSVVFGNKDTRLTNESTVTQATQTTALQLQDKPVIVSGVNGEEKRQVQKVVDTFESNLYAKDVTNALFMFTPPATKDEQNDLDFLLGKDLAQSTTKPLPRLFSTQGYNYTVSGHMIREIRKLNGNINVSVDELRTVYSGGEYVGYFTKIDSLIFELKTVTNGYKIDRYYHSKPTGKTLKYEGFIAE